MPPPTLTAADLMIAMAGPLPTSPGWAFEPKYDGFRALLVRRGDVSTLTSRNGNPLLPAFPEVAAACQHLPPGVYDAELVVADQSGLPSFSGIQQRWRLRRPSSIVAAAADRPATLCIFDVLAIGERDLRPLPLRERKAELARIAPSGAGLLAVRWVEEGGAALVRESLALNLEGIMAKRLDAPYVRGRSRHWIKVKNSEYVRVGPAANWQPRKREP